VAGLTSDDYKLRPCKKYPSSVAVPGAAIAIQTFGDFLGFNPHLHVLISDGCFHKSDLLTVAPNIDIRALERLFLHHVLTMLLDRGKITKDMSTSSGHRFPKSA